MRLRILAVSAMLICFALIGRSASADTISVQNSSFESTSSPLSPGGYNYGPIPSWTTTVTAGSWEPGSTFFTQPLPDGSTIAFVNGTIFQDLGVGLLPNETYFLSVFVGDRADGFNAASPWAISLGAGSLSCAVGGISGNIAPGTFADETCSFTTGSSVPSGDLFVYLSGVGQADFDNVRVTTPEPASVGLLAFGLFSVALIGGLYKRKQGLQSAA
jgi:hypothetical protein